MYFCGSTSLIAWSSTAPRPTWRSMTAGGTLPRRKPGTLICWAICLVRRVEARLELLEGHLDGQLGPGRAQGLDGALHRFLLSRGRSGAWMQSGRQDSNLRSPAPKAGALATTLRPAKRAPTGAPGPCLERMTGIEPA